MMKHRTHQVQIKNLPTIRQMEPKRRTARRNQWNHDEEDCNAISGIIRGGLRRNLWNHNEEDCDATQGTTMRRTTTRTRARVRTRRANGTFQCPFYSSELDKLAVVAIIGTFQLNF